MPRPGGNPDLKGNENSGRKSARVEHAKNEAIRKSWLKVNNELDNETELGLLKQTWLVEKVAVPIALRDMTEHKDVKVGGEVTLNKELTDEEFKKLIDTYEQRRRETDDSNGNNEEVN